MKKKALCFCVVILGVMSCHKKEPDAPKNQCTVSSFEQSSFQFIDEVDRLGKGVDSSVYLSKVVGNWKICCGKSIPIKEYCNRYYALDTINYAINFKPDFTFQVTRDAVKYQGKLEQNSSGFYKGYSDSSRFSIFIYSITDNKLRIGEYGTVGNYNSIYMKKD